jgi:hypothetical protein
VLFQNAVLRLLGYSYFFTTKDWGCQCSRVFYFTQRTLRFYTDPKAVKLAKRLREDKGVAVVTKGEFVAKGKFVAKDNFPEFP